MAAVLAGGWSQGDVVTAKIAHNSVSIGDEGTVAGPSSNPDAADAEQRVRVDFGEGKGSMNMIATSQIEGVLLAGGWVKFDQVVSRIDHNSIEIGDQGVVMGPSRNASATDAAERVNVDFGVGKGRVNVLASAQIEGAPLAGGMMKGDVVTSMIEHQNIKIGDRGTVLGPSTRASSADAGERVSVSFGAEKGIFNFLVVSQVRGIPLAGGWMKGDKVISKISHGGVEVDDEGVIVGPSSNATAADADQRVCVAFGSHGKRINMLVASQIEGAPLAGGWTKGDRVVSKIQCTNVEVGQEGVVSGPSLRPDADDASERVCVDFGAKGGCINMVAASHIKGAPLAGGWAKGDRVNSTIKHNNVEIDDEGIVQGPSTNPGAADASSRVCVDFGKEKGRMNLVAGTQFRGAKLAGTWVKGDVVVSKIKHKEVQVGDKGTVVGPTSNPKAADADRRVCVDFGPGKGTLNMLALVQIGLPPTEGASREEAEEATREEAEAEAEEAEDDGLSTLETDKGAVAESETCNDDIVDGPCLAAAHKVVTEAKVRAMFTATSGGKYSITRVEMLKHDRLLRMCSDMLENLDDRRSGPLRGVFSMNLPDDIDDDDKQKKAKLTSYLQRRFMTKEYAGGGHYSNVVPAWHGSKEDVLRSISRVGFACLVDSGDGDPGWYGTGRYTALEAELACLYASTYPTRKPKTADGEWVVMLSAVVVGLAYPITPGREDYPEGPLPPKAPSAFKFYGKSFRAPCDTHIAGIDGTTMMCVNPDDAKYHELVSSQDAQLLPLALVFFKPS